MHRLYTYTEPTHQTCLVSMYILACVQPNGVLQQNCLTNLKRLSDLTATEEPQLRAGSNSGTDFKKAYETILIISFFCTAEAIYLC